jgi:hypothetical protein
MFRRFLSLRILLPVVIDDIASPSIPKASQTLDVSDPGNEFHSMLGGSAYVRFSSRAQGSGDVVARAPQN